MYITYMYTCIYNIYTYMCMYVCMQYEYMLYKSAIRRTECGGDFE